MGFLRVSIKDSGWHIISATVFACLLAVMACPWGHTVHAKEIQKIDYLGNYPNKKSGSWTNKLQGIAHSGSDWLFTQNKALWKVPAHYDLRKTKKLSSNQKKWPGVLKVGMPAILKKKKYDHFGDLDCRRGYIFIPVEGGDRTPVIAVFKYPTLQFIDYAEMPGKTRSGWCAISNKGELFTSHNIINKKNPIAIYTIDWSLLRKGKLKLQFKKNYPLTGIPDAYGRDISTYIQGGDFSDDGKYLFIVNGKMLNPIKVDKGKVKIKTKEKTSDKGIWVFRNNNDRSGRFMMKSNQKKGFRYQFKPASAQEPEGLTYWDLDKNKHKNSRNEGQLHVLLLNKLIYKNHSVWIKHYRIHWK